MRILPARVNVIVKLFIVVDHAKRKTYRSQQLFSSTCHIHTRIKNEIYICNKKIKKKNFLRESRPF